MKLRHKKSHNIPPTTQKTTQWPNFKNNVALMLNVKRQRIDVGLQSFIASAAC